MLPHKIFFSLLLTTTSLVCMEVQEDSTNTLSAKRFIRKPHPAQVYTIRGKCFYAAWKKNRDIQDAISAKECYEQAAALNFLKAHLSLGKLLLAVTTTPNFNHYESFYQSSQEKSAESFMNHSIEHHLSKAACVYPKALTLLANYFMKLNRPQEALKYLIDTINHYCNHDKINEARRAFDHAIIIDKNQTIMLLQELGTTHLANYQPAAVHIYELIKLHVIITPKINAQLSNLGKKRKFNEQTFNQTESLVALAQKMRISEE